MVRTTGKNEKSLFVYAISQVDWTPMYRMDTCEAQFAFFDTIVETFRETFFPLKIVRSHSKDHYREKTNRA